ncbi:unnamed protein product, partial [marine sediment metagenome]
FKGTGRAVYRNRHHFDPWHAIEDELVLGLTDEPQEFVAGQEIARLVALWCPEQQHAETAEEELVIPKATPKAFWVKVDGYLCGCDFSGEPRIVDLAADSQ